MRRFDGGSVWNRIGVKLKSKYNGYEKAFDVRFKIPKLEFFGVAFCICGCSRSVFGVLPRNSCQISSLTFQ